MFRPFSKLNGLHIGATDGPIGKVEDLFLDDLKWTVRYLVADTGYWLPDRLVLLSPRAVRGIADDRHLVEVDLSRDQVEQSPPITADEPVSRQYERQYYNYFGWPAYWAGPGLWGPGPYPLDFAPLAALPAGQALDQRPTEASDPHLRSVKEMLGNHLRARDGEIGHVHDVLIEDSTWALRYLVIDTRNWLPGKKVLLAPQWIEQVSWEDASVTVDLAKQHIAQAPQYHLQSPVTRDYEVALFKHYCRPGYWSGPAESD